VTGCLKAGVVELEETAVARQRLGKHAMFSIKSVLYQILYTKRNESR
jgi:hypothetical protein